MRSKCIWMLGMLLALSACKSLPQRSSTQSAKLNQQQRTDILSACVDFNLRGKLAITQFSANGSDGGSGRFVWKQKSDVLDFRLSAPLSNQTWQLQGMPGAYTLTDSRGIARQNASAEQLIQDASGWTLPVTELRLWVLGLPTSDASNTISRYEDGTLKQFFERGWQVDYQSYTDAEPRLPIKIKAVLSESGKTRASVKIIVQDWSGCQ